MRRKLSKDIEKLEKQVNEIMRIYQIGSNSDWVNLGKSLNQLKLQAIIDEEVDNDYTYWEEKEEYSLEEIIYLPEDMKWKELRKLMDKAEVKE